MSNRSWSRRCPRGRGRSRPWGSAPRATTRVLCPWPANERRRHERDERRQPGAWCRIATVSPAMVGVQGAVAWRHVPPRCRGGRRLACPHRHQARASWTRCPARRIDLERSSAFSACDAGADRARDTGAADPAVAARVPRQILLVVGLGVVERSCLGELGRDRAVPGLASAIGSAPSRRARPPAGRPSSSRGPSGTAMPTSLPCRIPWVGSWPSQNVFSSVVVGDPRRVEGDEHGLGVAGAAGARLLVASGSGSCRPRSRRRSCRRRAAARRGARRPRSSPSRRSAVSIPSGNGGSSGVSSTTWGSVTGIGPGRPGSVSSGAGMSWDLRVKSMFLRYREGQNVTQRRHPARHPSRARAQRRPSTRVGQEQLSSLPCLAGGRSEGLLEVGPEHVRGLEPDRQPQQPFRAPLTLPAVPRLELRADAAEARGVLDHPVAVSTRRAASPSATSKEIEEAEPGVPDGL